MSEKEWELKSEERNKCKMKGKLIEKWLNINEWYENKKKIKDGERGRNIERNVYLGKWFKRKWKKERKIF